MSIRKRIEKEKIPQNIPKSDYGMGYNLGIKKAAYLAEARERELLAQRDELLAALKALWIVAQDSDGYQSFPGDALEAAYLAIAKVEGGGA